MDSGEEGGVGTNQGRVFMREQRAVGLAALLDPPVGQVHRLGTVLRGSPDGLLGLAVEVAVERITDSTSSSSVGTGPVLGLSVRAPPVELELGRLAGFSGSP